MDFITEGLGELLIWIVSGIVATITGAITVILNRKKVRNRMGTIDYGDHKEKRKKSYTRNLILDEHIAMRIKEDDSNFDDNVFKEWVKETFIEFQKAWIEENIDSISGRLDKSLYEQYSLLLNANTQNGYKNIIDMKKVNYIDFSSYSRDNEKEIVQVAINVVFCDYTIDEATNEIIAGSKDVQQRTTYKLTFYRKNGLQTKNTEDVLMCPNCGGSIGKRQSKCIYCNTWILECVRNWILNNIEKY